jgi:NAD(P)-dependent dehydrogenase (short-subunit alcohol dehydrogenase family)
MKLAGKTVVVVGGGTGIGRAVARAALEEGAQVLVAGRRAETLARAAEELGRVGTVRTCVADAGLERDVVKLLEASGEIDHLVVTAADLVYRPVAEVDADAARRVIDSKLLAALTFTSGVAAERPSPRGVLVAAVNGALNALGRALAVELAPLRVNVLSPGWVDTPLWEAVAGAGKAAAFEAMAPRLPARRIGRPEEMAQAALFLMQNGFTTGEVLYVDGGHRLA